MKLVANTWFRTGSAYTSNGICEFVKQTAASLPTTVSFEGIVGKSGMDYR